MVSFTSPNTILYAGRLNSALGLCVVVSPEILCGGIQWAMLKGLILLCTSAEQHEGDSSYSYTYSQYNHCTHNLHVQKDRGMEIWAF